MLIKHNRPPHVGANNVASMLCQCDGRAWITLSVSFSQQVPWAELQLEHLWASLGKFYVIIGHVARNFCMTYLDDYLIEFLGSK